MIFNDVLDEVRSDDIGKRDIVVPVRDIEYVGPGEISIGDDGAVYDMTNWAFGQFCERLGVPAGYMNKCAYELQSENFDYWLAERCYRLRTTELAGCWRDRLPRDGRIAGNRATLAQV